MTSLRSLCAAALVAVLCAGSALAQSGGVMASETPSDRVAAALEVGAYGEALAAAGDEADAATRAGLLSQIAAAQTASGTTSRGDRVAQPAARPATSDLAGGTGADFDSLITLIQNQTGGGQAWVTDGGTGTIDPFESGVRVDAQGLLVRVGKVQQRRQLEQLRRTVRTADLPAAMSQPTDLRLVSLNQLEAAAAAAIARGEAIPETALRLGGLTRIRYVFLDDATGEIVLGGPAEGWGYDAAGRAIGTASGQPILNLDDLVVVLRAFEGVDRFGCSIDPRAENLQALQQVVARTAGRSLAAGATRGWVKQLETALGRQDVTVHGVPAESRVSRVMVEADYRMKLIGAGQLASEADIPSYFDLLAQNPQHIGGSVSALRWWLTLDADAVVQDAGGRHFELDGSSVVCRSENQLLTAEGQRVPTGQADAMNELFAQRFTAGYERLAAAQPIFADLQGLFDLSIAAALISRERLDETAGWDRGCFARGGAFATARYPAVREVDSVVTYRVFGGSKVVVQAAGGVSNNAVELATDRQRRTVSPRLESVATEALQTRGDRWFWNAR